MQINFFPEELFSFCGVGDDNIPQIKKILEQRPEYIHSLNRYNENCLMVAAYTKNNKTVQFLVDETDINLLHSGDFGDIIKVCEQSDNMEARDYILNSEAYRRAKGRP